MYYDPTDALTTLTIARPAGVDDAQATYLKVQALANTPVPEVIPETATAETVEQAIREHAQARAAQQYARDIHERFRRHADRGVRELYRADASRVLKDLAKASVKPLKVIAEAAKHLAPTDSADTILERDDAAVNAWRNRADVEQAADTLNLIEATSRVFADLSGTGESSAPTLLWWLDITDADELDRVQHETRDLECPGGMFLALAHDGRRLALASPAEAMARNAAVRRSRERAENAHKIAQTEAEAAENRRRGARELEAHARLMVKQ